MTEIKQSAEALEISPDALPDCRRIEKSVYLETDGHQVQVAYLELCIPPSTPDADLHTLDLEADSLMRSVVSVLGARLMEGCRWTGS